MATAYVFDTYSGACIQFLIDVLVLQDFRSWPLHGFAINDRCTGDWGKESARAPAREEKTPAVSCGSGDDGGGLSRTVAACSPDSKSNSPDTEYNIIMYCTAKYDFHDQSENNKYI